MVTEGRPGFRKSVSPSVGDLSPRGGGLKGGGIIPLPVYIPKFENRHNPDRVKKGFIRR